MTKMTMDTVRYSSSVSQISNQTTQNQTNVKAKRNTEILTEIEPILREAQHENRSTKLLLDKMNELFQHNPDKKVFTDVLWRVMLVPIVDPKNENAARLITFFQQVLTNIGKESSADETAGNDNILTIYTLKLCSKYHLDTRYLVRLRICEVAVSLLKSFTNINEQISQSLQEKLVSMMLHRLEDKSNQVRVQSAQALAILQSCEAFEDRIINGLMYHIRWDPCAEVRATISKHFSFKPGNYEYIIEKVNDVSDDVRKVAVRAIADNIPMDTLKIAERERILQSSLEDKSSQVNKMGMFLLKEWVKFCDDNHITFLGKLDVSFNRRTAELTLKNLFRDPTPELFDTVDRSFFKDKFIPLEEITEEKAFYWRYIVETFTRFPSIAELLLPTIPDICSYLNDFVKMYGGEEHREMARNILAQLLKICRKIQMEEGGRTHFITTILDLFNFHNLNEVCIKLVLKLFYLYQEGDVEGVLIETLQRMVESSKIVEEAPAAPIISESDIKALKLDIGTMIHTRHKKEREKNVAVEASNYLRAQELQDEINGILEEIENLRSHLSNMEHGIKPTAEEVNPETGHHSPLALSHAFCALIVHIRRSQSVSSPTRAFYETYVTPSICNDDEFIRKQVLTLMTLFGLVCKTDAIEASVVCAQALIFDEVEIKVRALHCLVDLIQHYGFDEFKDHQALNDVIEKLENSQPKPPEEQGESPLRNLLMHYLRHTDVVMVRHSVTGIIKLLLANRLSAQRIVTTLLSLWSNPVTDPSRMFHEISTWLPIYVRMGLDHAMKVGDALIPCLQKIRSAPKSAYLSHAPVDRLIAMVVNYTDQKFLTGYVETPEVIHERITLGLLKEMKSIGPCSTYSCYAKALKSINLLKCSEESIHHLKRKTAYLIKKSNKKTLPSLTAFLRYLKTLYEGDVRAEDSETSSPSGSEDESDNVEIETYATAESGSDESQEILGASPDR